MTRRFFMKTVAEFDLKNYSPEWKTFFREAVRVIIIKDGKLAMVKSGRIGYYKFPGGGRRPGESYVRTAIRETLEETGLSVIEDSVREFGRILEKRKSNRHPGEIFNQVSYYYYAAVDSSLSEQRLDGYEREEGYTLEWVDIAAAYETDLEFYEKRRSAFLKRELFVLGELLKADKEDI